MLTGQQISQSYPDVIFHRPRLDDEPAVAIEKMSHTIAALLQHQQQVALIGSSLGGFYSHYLAEQFQLPAVLINPAVAPYRLLANYLGIQTNPYTGKVIELTTQHMAELKSLEAKVNRADLIQVWLEKGDEVLDYRLAQAYFSACDCRVRANGDHSYQAFEQDCPAMLEFLLGPAGD